MGAGASDLMLGRQAAPLRVAVVRNPRSHRNKRRSDGADALVDIVADVAVVTPEDTAGLTAALAGFARDGIDVLVVDGGDGTVRDVLTCGAGVFGTRWPRLAVLPKGKTNALAVDLGLPRLWSLAEALAAARRGGEIVRRPLVVDRDGDGAGVLTGFLLGTGAFIAAIEAGQVTHRRGAFQSFAVLVTLVTALGSALLGIGDGALRRLSAMRLFDGSGAELPQGRVGEPGRRYLALFSTLRKLPVGVMPFRRADRAIRFFVVDAPRRRTLARIPAVLCGAEAPADPHRGIHRGADETFTLELGREGFVLDGEHFAATRASLRQGPELRFVVP